MGQRDSPVSKMFAQQICWPEFNPQHAHKDVVAHACNPNIEEVDIGR